MVIFKPVYRQYLLLPVRIVGHSFFVQNFSIQEMWRAYGQNRGEIMSECQTVSREIMAIWRTKQKSAYTMFTTSAESFCGVKLRHWAPAVACDLKLWLQWRHIDYVWGLYRWNITMQSDTPLNYRLWTIFMNVTSASSFFIYSSPPPSYSIFN